MKILRSHCSGGKSERDRTELRIPAPQSDLRQREVYLIVFVPSPANVGYLRTIFGSVGKWISQTGCAMADSQSVIPFTSDDHLEAAGQTILKLLHKAADVAEATSPAPNSPSRGGTRRRLEGLRDKPVPIVPRSDRRPQCVSALASVSVSEPAEFEMPVRNDRTAFARHPVLVDPAPIRTNGIELRECTRSTGFPL